MICRSSQSQGIFIGQLIYTWIHEFGIRKGKDIWNVQGLCSITGAGSAIDAQVEAEVAERVLGKGSNMEDLTKWFGECTSFFRSGAHMIVDTVTSEPSWIFLDY